MSLSPEEASDSPAEKASETASCDCADRSGDTIEPAMQRDLKLFHRRKQLLITYYSGLLNPVSMRELASSFKCTQAALYLDWSKRDRWEPLIWEHYEANEDGKVLVKQLQLSRETALVLMKNPRVGGNARVGAIARFTDAIKTEVELKQSLGILPKAKLDPLINLQNTIQVESNVSVNELLKHYQQFVQEGDQAGAVRKNDSVESVDKAEANPKAEGVS